MGTRRIDRPNRGQHHDGVIDDQLPRTLGRYRLGDAIGAGGMATVYTGWLTGAGGFERKVAVKVMHAHLGRQQAFVDMFLDEARIAAKVHHPNVCQVFDFGEDRGRYYLAMEYLHGRSLSTIIRRSVELHGEAASRYFGFVAGVIGGIAEGLHAAHELGIVHRDVSPTNIVVTQEGVAKIVDFGIATARDRIHHTAHGVVKGNFAYISPEHLMGARVNARSDVWSLGVVAWESCTRCLLFRSASPQETVRAVEHRPIPRPSAIEPLIPPSIDDVILRALQRDPDRRHPTARAFKEDYLRARPQRWPADSTEMMSRWMQDAFQTLSEEANPDGTTVGRRAKAPRLPPQRLKPFVVVVCLAFAIGAYVSLQFIQDPVSRSGHGVQKTSVDNRAVFKPSPRLDKPHLPRQSIVTPTNAPAREKPNPPAEPKSTVGKRASRRASKRRPTGSRGFGELQLVTTGVGTVPVYLNGKLLAWSPLVERLPAGTHVLEVRAAGQPPQKVRVTVRQNTPTRVVVNLD